MGGPSARDKAQLIMFSPLPFSAFMRCLAQRQQHRFLDALTTLYKLGPILVRVPDAANSDTVHRTALSA